MRRVLIVSPSFPPINAADMHRVRLSLPYLRENGWEATVLAVAPEFCDQPREERLLQTVPDGIRVERVRAIDRRLTRAFGIGNFALRAYPFLQRRGANLLAAGGYDLVLFSTTAFATINLGTTWRRRYRVPFVIDLQDPWLSDYYRRPGAPPPPGGRLKYGIVQGLAAHQERRAMRATSQVISVSPAYPETLLARYPWMRPDQFTVLPFGADPDDLRLAGQATQAVFDPADGLRHWVYVGRAGGDMAKALAGFFLALAQIRAKTPNRFTDLKLHFIGTSYAQGGQGHASVEPVAEQYGVADLVQESPARVPYFVGLRCLLDAHALVVPGSDDPGYTASKIFPYLMARRPLLAIFHEQSSVVDMLRSTGGGSVVAFSDEMSVGEIADRVHETWFCSPMASPRTDWAAFEPFTARQMSRRLCAVLDAALESEPGRAAGRFPKR